MNPRRRRRNRKGRVRARRWFNGEYLRLCSETFLAQMARSSFLTGDFMLKITDAYYSPSLQEFVEMRFGKEE